MGERFQEYVSYGKGENLFAMHLQWCWGPFSIVRAHQLVSFLDGARQNTFNPFGIGECSRVGGMSFDGRREDLYLLRALTEINILSSSTVEGHDLMVEQNQWDEDQFKRGDLPAFPKTVTIDPSAQDNNHGCLVIQANESEIKYCFCESIDEMEPISAEAYMRGYSGDLHRFDEKEQDAIRGMLEDLSQYQLLSKKDLQHIFEKPYSKELNIEGYQAPQLQHERGESLNNIVEKAKRRIENDRADPGTENQKDVKTCSPKRNRDPTL